MGSLEPEKDLKQELNDSGCVQDSSVSENYKGQAHLLDLSDDVLLCILRLCTPRDLKALGHTCRRLGLLICDRTLWLRVDARSGPVGLERMRWLLNYCLSPATQELQVTGYVDRDIRCLGIQDLTWPLNGEPGAQGAVGQGGVDVEHFLLRMWYPHLPRYCPRRRPRGQQLARGFIYAMSPRWPDRREAVGKAIAQRLENNNKRPLSPLSKLASQIEAEDSSGPSTSKSLNSSGSGRNSSNAGQNSSNAGQSSSNGGPSQEDDDDMAGHGCHGPQFTFNQSLLKALRTKCQNLTSLVLEYCNLDYKNTNLRHFPPKLKKLSLKGTRCYNLPLNTSYLGKIQDRLPDLEYLDISECEWFEPASLMPLSKVPKLRQLYMRDCRRLTECVAYASLATRYGFQELRILDVRGSPVADSEVSAFGWLPHLEELYVAPPEDFSNRTEHSHKWDDVLLPFNELDPWESEEPEYFKCKSPTQDGIDEDEEQGPREEGEPVVEERLGDVMLGNYINCASLERRIIVIHPNRQSYNESRNRQEAQQGEVEVEAEIRPVAAEPNPPAAEPEPAPQPGPSKRPNTDNGLDLVKRPRLDKDPTAKRDGQTPQGSRPPRPPQGPLRRPGASRDPPGGPPRPSPNCRRGPLGRGGHGRLGPNGRGHMPGGQRAGVRRVGFGLPRPDGHGRPGARGGLRQGAVIRRIGLGGARPGVNAREVANAGAQRRDPENAAGDVGDLSSANNPNRIPVLGIPPPPRPPRFLEGQEHNLNTIALEIHNRYVQEELARLTPEQPMASVSVNIRPISAENANNIQLGEQIDDDIDDPHDNLGPQHILQHIVQQPQPDRAANDRPPVAGQAQPIPEPEAEDLWVGDHINIAWDRPERQRRRYIQRAGEGQPIMHIDVDIQRQNLAQPMPQFGYHLVSDSAVLRFGRADNDNINYVHIGQNNHANDPGVRPDRSNLRVLSITGYRNITDRSLEHLATAAPHIRFIDFSQTNVTARGVEVFKAIRPNCEVIHSEYGNGG